jgi:transcriptional regulator with XRE-family HTH domain
MSISGHMRCYGSMGELIQDYLALAGMKKEALAEVLGVDPKTLSRWGRDRHPSVQNLQTFARITRLPFQLLLHVAHGIPTFANLRSRRIAFSEWELEFVNRSVIQKKLFRASPPPSIHILGVQGALAEVLPSRPQVYPRERRPAPEVVQRAVEIAPSLNLVARGPALDGWKDQNGRPTREYSGHVLILPLGEAAHAQLRTMEDNAPQLHEHDLTADQLVPLGSPHLRTLHISSFFAFTSQIAYALLHTLIHEILRHRESLEQRQCCLSQYVVTADGDELADKLGLRSRFGHLSEKVGVNTEITPEYREAPISQLEWLRNYHSEVRV